MIQCRMASDLSLGALPNDLAHAVHAFLPIAEVFTLRRVSRPVRELILRSFSLYSWDAVHRVGMDTADAHSWLTRLCDAGMNLRSLRVVRALRLPINTVASSFTEVHAAVSDNIIIA